MIDTVFCQIVELAADRLITYTRRGVEGDPPKLLIYRINDVGGSLNLAKSK